MYWGGGWLYIRVARLIQTLLHSHHMNEHVEDEIHQSFLPCLNGWPSRFLCLAPAGSEGKEEWRATCNALVILYIHTQRVEVFARLVGLRLFSSVCSCVRFFYNAQSNNIHRATALRSPLEKFRVSCFPILEPPPLLVASVVEDAEVSSLKCWVRASWSHGICHQNAPASFFVSPQFACLGLGETRCFNRCRQFRLAQTSSG